VHLSAEDTLMKARERLALPRLLITENNLESVCMHICARSLACSPSPVVKSHINVP
jgi:hypothetical protein